MCTAISITDSGHLFGRTLDLEYTLGESVVVAPRGFSAQGKGHFSRQMYAIIGMAHIVEGVPLFYDAMNEHGLAAAALNFPTYAVYSDHAVDKRCIPSYALIPELLGCCRSVGEAKRRLVGAAISSLAFSEALPPTPLHWIVSDKSGSIIIESVEDGLKIYDNPLGVLSNSPSFPYQVAHLAAFMSLSPRPPENSLAPGYSITPYSGGMAAMGLPGDLSSTSRFVRTVYAKMHTRPAPTAEISRFFHIMGMVNTPRGTVEKESGEAVSTVYTSCMDLDSKIYYFTTYENRRIRSVRLMESDAVAEGLASYSIGADEDIDFIN